MELANNVAHIHAARMRWNPAEHPEPMPWLPAANVSDWELLRGVLR